VSGGTGRLKMPASIGKKGHAMSAPTMVEIARTNADAGGFFWSLDTCRGFNDTPHNWRTLETGGRLFIAKDTPTRPEADPLQLREVFDGGASIGSPLSEEKEPEAWALAFGEGS